MQRPPQIGDYVVATKYYDGDPGDHFCIGTLDGVDDHQYGERRYWVIDNNGQQFRANGFRRTKQISPARGGWLVARLHEIEQSSHSVWWWVRQPMSTNERTMNAATA